MAMFPPLSLLLQSQHQSTTGNSPSPPCNSCTHIRRVCRASIGLFQIVKHTSNVLFQEIKAATNAVMPTRQDGKCTDVHQQTYTIMLHSNTTHTSSTCSYNALSTSTCTRSVSSVFFTASSPITPVKPQKGASSSLICASPSLNDVLFSDGCGSFSRVSGTLIASGSSSPCVQYFRGQYILGGSFNLEVFGKLGEGGFGTV